MENQTSKFSFFEEKIKEKKISPAVIFRLVAVFLTAWYFILAAKNPEEWRFIDGVNLIFHEAGHSIVFFLGEFVQIAAGSIFQILVPAVLSLYFFGKKQFFSASLLLFWVGQSFVNISVYAKDSILMNLPLLGGDSTIHDWNYMLTNLGLLEYTAFIGGAIWFLGAFIILSAFILSLWTSFVPEKEDYSRADPFL